MTIGVTSDDGKTISPLSCLLDDFTMWYAQDQHVFSYLLTTLWHEMAIQVVSCHAAVELWRRHPEASLGCW